MKVKAVAHSRIPSRAFSRRSRNWFRITPLSPVPSSPIFVRPTAEGGLENTHPFTRELWGRNWTYAHNGQLKGYKSLKTGNFHPVGETDSEKAFCWLLHRLTERYPRTPGNMLGVFKYIATLAGELREKGVFNMLLSDGRYVMAFCSTNLHWITRRAPFGVAKLLDQDVEIDFQRETTPNDVVTVIATQPLTANETWHKIMPGEWALFCLGERVV